MVILHVDIGGDAPPLRWQSFTRVIDSLERSTITLFQIFVCFSIPFRFRSNRMYDPKKSCLLEGLNSGKFPVYVWLRAWTT